MAFCGIYDLAKKAGFTEGDAVGYQRGHDFGYQEGRENGYAEWFRPRYGQGYRDGRENARVEWYQPRYDNGYTDGYDNGINYMLTHGYPIADPTYQEAMEFLAKDPTDKHEYVENEYVCRHFAHDVCNNAEKAGIRCAYVAVGFPEGGHALVAFSTVDENLIFVEPMTDEVFEVEVGRPYWPRDKYLRPAYDDTVMEILIVW